MTLRSLDILGKYSLYNIPRDDGGDDGGTGDDGGDAFGFGATGDFGLGYDGMSTADGEGSAAADAGYAAGEAAAAAVAAAAGDGSLGGGDYGSYAGTAAGDAIAAGYGLATGDYGTGTGDAFGFDAGGYVGTDAFGDYAGGLSGYEGFGAADGGIGSAAAADAANAAAALGQGWGAYAAGTTAAAIANALAAQGKAPGWIEAAIASPSFATGFSQGLAAAIAGQAQQAAQMAAQGIFGVVGPNSPMANPAMVDQYNAVVAQVTQDVTAAKTAQVNSLFGLDLSNPITVSFKDWDAVKAVNPMTAQQEVDEQMDVPAPLSEQFGVPAGMPTAGLGIYGGALSPGITTFSPGPLGPLGPLGPTSPLDVQNLEPPGIVDLNYDPKNPFPGIVQSPEPQLDENIINPENPMFRGPDIVTPDDLMGRPDFQRALDEIIGRPVSLDLEQRDPFQQAIDDVLSVTKQTDIPGIVDQVNRDAIIDVVSPNPAMLAQDWGFQARGPTAPAVSQVDPTSLMDDPIGFMTAVNPAIESPNPGPEQFSMDWGFPAPATSVTSHVGSVAPADVSPNPEAMSVFGPNPMGPSVFSPIDWSTFVSPIDFSQFNVDPPQFNNPITFENQSPLTGAPSWATGQFGSLDFTGLNPNAPFGPNPDPGPFVGPMDPGAPTSVTVGGTFSGDPSGAPTGGPSAFGDPSGGLLGGLAGGIASDPGVGNVDPSLLWWMLQQQQGAPSGQI